MAELYRQRWVLPTIDRPQSTSITRCIMTRSNFIEYILNTRFDLCWQRFDIRIASIDDTSTKGWKYTNRSIVN